MKVPRRAKKDPYSCGKPTANGPCILHHKHIGVCMALTPNVDEHSQQEMNDG